MKKINPKNNDKMVIEKPNLTWNTNLHVYSKSLIVGDAYSLIDKIKNQPDVYLDFFYDDEKGSYVNEIDKIHNKNVDCFSLQGGGGFWTPIFSMASTWIQGKKDDEFGWKSVGREYPFKDSFFLDFCAGINVANFPMNKKTSNKNHLKIINDLVSNSINNTDPIFTLSTPSNSLLFMEAGDMLFNPKDENFKVDYKNKTTKEIFNELYNLCHYPEIKFLNFEHGSEEFTFDFYIDFLENQKYEVYKVESIDKDLDFYRDYYVNYYDPLPGGHDKDFFQSTIDTYGYLHGYYIKASKQK